MEKVRYAKHNYLSTKIFMQYKKLMFDLYYKVRYFFIKQCSKIRRYGETKSAIRKP